MAQVYSNNHLFKVVRQLDSMQCGIACLAMICNYYGKNISLRKLSAICPASHDGISLLAIKLTAESIVKSDAMGAVGSFLCWKFWGQTLAGGLMFGPTGAVVAAKEMIKGTIVTSGLHTITGV